MITYSTQTIRAFYFNMSVLKYVLITQSVQVRVLKRDSTLSGRNCFPCPVCPVRDTYSRKIGQFFLFTGTKHTGSAQASLILNVEPLISIGAAIILLGEQMTIAQYIGVSVVITALFLAGDNLNKFFLKQKRQTVL